MTRNVLLLLVCTTIFLSMMLVSASADKEELLGLDVFVVGHHAYVAEGTNGFYVVDIRRPGQPKAGRIGGYAR